MSFDFNKIERRFLPVKLKDGRDLVLKMPTKKVYEKISTIQELDTGAMSGGDAVDTISALCAEVLCNNLNDITITAKEVIEDYEIEEQQIFIEAYIDFAKGATNDPN